MWPELVNITKHSPLFPVSTFFSVIVTLLFYFYWPSMELLPGTHLSSVEPQLKTTLLNLHGVLVVELLAAMHLMQILDKNFKYLLFCVVLFVH